MDLVLFLSRDLLYAEAIAAALEVSPEIQVVVYQPGSEAPDPSTRSVVVLCRSVVDFAEQLAPIRDLLPGAAAIAVGPFDQSRDVTNAITLGALGVVSTSGPLQSIAEAISEVRDDRRYACPVSTGILIRDLAAGAANGAATRPPAHLTPRELQVLKAICDGMTDRQTATALGLRESTVRSHREGLMRKLEVRGVAQLVRKAIETRLI